LIKTSHSYQQIVALVHLVEETWRPINNTAQQSKTKHWNWILTLITGKNVHQSWNQLIRNGCVNKSRNVLLSLELVQILFAIITLTLFHLEVWIADVLGHYVSINLKTQKAYIHTLRIRQLIKKHWNQ
jgi:hypothetical protein